MCDTVGDIREFFGRIIIEIAEDTLFDNVAVQFRYAVHGMRADNGQIRHAHGVIRDDRHTRNLVPIPGETFPEIFAEAAIDLLQNRINTRQSARDQIFRPRFQRFRQHGVIRVCAKRRGDIPRFIPTHAVFVDQKSHQFGNRKRGMRIIQVNRSKFR